MLFIYPLSQSKIVLIPSDKNQGPVVLDCHDFVQCCLHEHLLTPNYLELSTAPSEFVGETASILSNFLHIVQDIINNEDYTFLLHSLNVDNPFANFYTLAKIHKNHGLLVQLFLLLVVLLMALTVGFITSSSQLFVVVQPI